MEKIVTEKFKDKYRIKSHRLEGYDYSSNGAYFLTICVREKECVFGDIVEGKMILNNWGKIVHKEWQKTEEIRKNVIVDEFVIMPNHVHGILMITNVETPRWGVSNQNNISNKNRNDEKIIQQENSNKNENTNNVKTPRWGVSNKNDISNKKEKSQNTETPHRGVSTNHKPEWKSGCLGAIINQFKSVCTKQIRKKSPDFFWQPNYYDRIIRNEDELNRIREYIIHNPKKWDLEKNNVENIFM